MDENDALFLTYEIIGLSCVTLEDVMEAFDLLTQLQKDYVIKLIGEIRAILSKTEAGTITKFRETTFADSTDFNLDLIDLKRQAILMLLNLCLESPRQTSQIGYIRP